MALVTPGIEGKKKPSGFTIFRSPWHPISGVVPHESLELSWLWGRVEDGRAGLEKLSVADAPQH